MHFIYQINRLTTTKVDSTQIGSLANIAQRICSVAGLERMTTGSAVRALPYLATQVDRLSFLGSNLNSYSTLTLTRYTLILYTIHVPKSHVPMDKNR